MPETYMDGAGFFIQQRSHDFNVPLSGIQDTLGGQGHRFVFGIIVNDLGKLGFGQTINNPRNPRPVDRACAHRTGFRTRVQRGGLQNLWRELTRSQPNQIGFGVPRDVMLRNDRILRFKQYLAFNVSQERAKGMITMGARGSGDGDGAAQ
jgi:hypothetical protein